jgi:hypothetical protein
MEKMPAPRIRHYEPVRDGGPLSISTSRNTGSSDLSWMAS